MGNVTMAAAGQEQAVRTRAAQATTIVLFSLVMGCSGGPGSP